MGLGSLVCLILSVLLGLQQGLCAGDPEVVDVTYISRWLFQPTHRLNLLAADPSISVSGVPMPGHHTIEAMGMDPNAMNRMMRIYMPRSFHILVQGEDVVIMHEAPFGSLQFPQVYFDAKWISWFVEGVQEEGMAFGMWGGDASFGGTYGGEGWYKSWGETMLDNILPFECFVGFDVEEATPHKPHFLDPDHPLGHLPWGHESPITLLNKVEFKAGANRIAEASVGQLRSPWIGSWRSGKGRVVCETIVTGSRGAGNGILDWAWFQDFVVYLTYLTIGKAIPDDIYTVHEVRREIGYHLGRTSLLVSLLEFVDRFGASTITLYSELEGLNQRKREAEELYRQEQYAQAAQTLKEMQDAWADLEIKAVEAKEKALAWVYLIEWLTVLGVFLISGTFLWSVMVRRRLYRETPTTGSVCRAMIIDLPTTWI